MNWFRLEVVRHVLLSYDDVELVSSVVGSQRSVEIWKRVVDGEEHWVSLDYKNDEFLVPQTALTDAADGLGLPAAFMEQVRAAGGLWTGLDPDT